MLHDLDDTIVRALVKTGVIKELTALDIMGAPSPTQVSNRTIHERCIAWGCKVTRTNGNWVWMQSPMGQRFKVRPPQQHEANAKSTIDEMLEALVLPWSVFITAEVIDVKELLSLGEGFKQSDHHRDLPGDLMGPCSICGEDVVRALMVKQGKKIAHRYCVAARKAAAEQQRAQQTASPPPPQEESSPVPPDTLEVVYTPDNDELSVTADSDRPARASGIINRVFDLLVERGDSMSNQAVAEQLEITQQQATSALAGLCQQGVITRVKAGVYQAKPHVTRRNGNFGLVLSGDGSLDHEPTSAQQQVNSSRLQRIVREAGLVYPTGPDAEPPSMDEDETLNEILDLIAPDGFKARHLPLIDAFKRTALALIREVQTDA